MTDVQVVEHFLNLGKLIEGPPHASKPALPFAGKRPPYLTHEFCPREAGPPWIHVLMPEDWSTCNSTSSEGSYACLVTPFLFFLRSWQSDMRE